MEEKVEINMRKLTPNNNRYSRQGVFNPNVMSNPLVQETTSHEAGAIYNDRPMAGNYDRQWDSPNRYSQFDTSTKYYRDMIQLENMRLNGSRILRNQTANEQLSQKQQMYQRLMDLDPSRNVHQMRNNQSVPQLP